MLGGELGWRIHSYQTTIAIRECMGARGKTETFVDFQPMIVRDFVDQGLRSHP